MTDAGSQREAFSIDAAHPALAGHFPGNPVVPGVVLLERVLDAAQRRFGIRADALRLPQVKFLQPLLPGQLAEIVFDTVVLDTVAREQATTDATPVPDTRIRFRIERAGSVLASGEMVAPAAGGGSPRRNGRGMSLAHGPHWQQRPEGGGLFALWLIRSVALHTGRLPSRLLLFPITLYFLLVRGPERRASRAFLGRVFGRPATLWEVARHIHTFAATILDRVFLLSEQFRRYDLDVHGLDALHVELDKGRGVLLFGAHVGSFEALRVLSLKRPDISVRVVLDKGQSPALTRLLDALNPDIASTVIDAAQPGTAIVLALKEAAEQKAAIGLLVDRAKSGEPAVACPFFGTPALFPSAPALIAAALQIPVVLCFGLYRGRNRYDVHFETFSEGLVIPRNNRREVLTQVLTRYAARLEYYARLSPYNWFNFYDFWNLNAQAGHARSEPPVSSVEYAATTAGAAVVDAGDRDGIGTAGRGGA